MALAVSRPNPWDVCASTNGPPPAASPDRGRMLFGTNEACWGDSSRLDTTNVRYHSTKLRYTATFAPTWEPVTFNQWTTSNSPTACLYKPFSGKLVYRYKDTDFDRIHGTLDFTSATRTGCGQSHYAAKFHGRFVGNQTFG